MRAGYSIYMLRTVTGVAWRHELKLYLKTQRFQIWWCDGQLIVVFGVGSGRL